MNNLVIKNLYLRYLIANLKIKKYFKDKSDSVLNRTALKFQLLKIIKKPNKYLKFNTTCLVRHHQIIF